MEKLTFNAAFEALTRYPPFPWQEKLYERFMSADPRDNVPTACSLPTGLGKTMVIAVWLIALAARLQMIPRRLVYVVNRRTVVDQSTEEAKKLRDRLKETPAIDAALRGLCAVTPDPDEPPLAISTLRGQFADNREWSADPARPAVVVGTVDMIGSRLLFSGYGCGFKTRPLHAGFLGQDVLLVHDEAHLEPAFQDLLIAIRKEQERCQEFRPFRVMELTATSRGSADVFTLSDEDHRNETVKKRIEATKHIELYPVADEKSALVKEVVARAFARAQNNATVVVFVRSVDRAGEIAAQLAKAFPKAVESLTGTLRGKERDELVDKPVFRRFLPGGTGAEPTGPAFLVCTSAGEVGVNISADHLVCDLSTFDSMAQRFGRVNRFGDCPDSRIDIVYPKDMDEKGELSDLDVRRKVTLDLLRLANGDGSPAALRELHRKAMKEGSGTPPMSTDQTRALREYILSTYAPQPKTLPTSDILFDAWALTTARELPGRPRVDEYLHGVEDEKQFDTEFAWREEVALLTGKVRAEDIAELMDDFPLKPHEVLRVTTYGKGRAYDQLVATAEREPDLPAWVIEPDGKLTVYEHLSMLVAKKGKDFAVPLAARTVVLPPRAGGLTDKGTLQGDAPYSETISYDVAGIPPPKVAPLLRLKVVTSEGENAFRRVAPTRDWEANFSVPFESARTRFDDLNDYLEERNQPPVKPGHTLDLQSDSDDDTQADGASEYLIARPIPKKTHHKAAAEWPHLDVHREGVRGLAVTICSRLGLDPVIGRAVELAAWWHDLGKGRRVWQLGAGNRSGFKPVSKTLHGRPPENLNHFRHELGSVIDVCGDPALAAEFGAQKDWVQDLTLHLIAAHHGRARPHFPGAEADDPERPAEASAAVAADTPGRFARLQRQFGRWGLAYLESLIRAADALDSKRIEETPIADGEPGTWPRIPPGFAWRPRRAMPEPTIQVNVDPTNPGQFFACCGLLELADRLWPGAEGWFAQQKFNVACTGTLEELLARLLMDPPEELTTLENGLGVKRIIAPLRFTFDGGASHSLTVDVWTKTGVASKRPAIVPNRPWNLWSGHQKSFEIWSDLRLALAQQLPCFRGTHAETLLTQRVPLTGRFGFDPGAAWNKLDVGFSPNTVEMPVASSPAIELLAAVGIQRFRPLLCDDGKSFYYATWGQPLLPLVAAAAASGLVLVEPAIRLRGRVVDRGEYAALAYSTILKGAANE